MATLNALSGISQMTNTEIHVSQLECREVVMADARTLLGNPEETIVGVYLSYDGAARGHILLSFTEEVARQMVDLAMGQPPGTTVLMGEMEASVMGEMGNIAGSFFLNELANTIGAAVQPSPPAPIRDMAGAIMDVVIAQTMQSLDKLYLLDLSFQANERSVAGHLLVVPTEGVLSPG